MEVNYTKNTREIIKILSKFQTSQTLLSNHLNPHEDAILVFTEQQYKYLMSFSS